MKLKLLSTIVVVTALLGTPVARAQQPPAYVIGVDFMNPKPECPVFIGYVTAGVNFSNLEAVPVEGVDIKYGLFLNAIIQFLITAIALFFLIKGINMIRKPAPAKAPVPSPSEVYLKEIRDALVKR